MRDGKNYLFEDFLIDLKSDQTTKQKHVFANGNYQKELCGILTNIQDNYSKFDKLKNKLEILNSKGQIDKEHIENTQDTILELMISIWQMFMVLQDYKCNFEGKRRIKNNDKSR